MRNCFLLFAVALLSFVTVATAADQSPATQPATQPAGFEMTPEADVSIGLSFDRPAKWRTDGAKVLNPKSGQTDLVFEMDGFDAGTKLTLKFSGENAGGEGGHTGAGNDPENLLSWARWREVSGQKKGSQVADPNFVDPENGDFTVKPDSPIVGWGLLSFKIDPQWIGASRTVADRSAME